MRKENILASGMGLSQSEANKSGEEAELEEEVFWVTETAWEGEESGKGESSVQLKYILEADEVKANEDEDVSL